MNLTLLYLVFSMVAAAVILLALSSRQQKAAGLPGGRVIYADTRHWGPVEKPFYDAELGLTGKPDYLVEQGGNIIPVEVKSARNVQAPYDAHIFQLAAYCLLVSRQKGKRPPYGLIHYVARPSASPGQGGTTFVIDYTPELEQAVLNLLNEIRASERLKDVPRSHQLPHRCARCGYRSLCDQKL